MADCENRTFCCVSRMSVENLVTEETREVKQWHFTTWPKGRKAQKEEADHILAMLSSVRAFQDAQIVLPKESPCVHVQPTHHNAACWCLLTRADACQRLLPARGADVQCCV